VSGRFLHFLSLLDVLGKLSKSAIESFLIGIVEGPFL
jgi:hypothetical protein